VAQDLLCLGLAGELRFSVNKHPSPLYYVSKSQKGKWLTMAIYECPCCKIIDCDGPDDCPVKNHPSGKNCWEVSFLHNNWEKVFEKCRTCKVFKLKASRTQQSS
jgi:hypothetical protein